MTASLKRYCLTHEGLIISVKEFRTSRCMRLIVHSGGSVTLTCPPRTTKMSAAQYLLKNFDWLRRTVERQKVKVEMPGVNTIVATPELTKALRSKAAAYVPGRLKHLAALNGLGYKSVKITATRSKWGSCSSLGQICVSCYVMALPVELVDFVLLHELAHTRHMNHSKKFHDALDAMLPAHNERQLNKIMKTYNIVKP